MASNSDAAAQPKEHAKTKEDYERMDPTNHPKLQADPSNAQKEQDLKLMSKVNDLKVSANDIGFSFRTDIDNLHSFYDETLQDFLQNVKGAALAEAENLKKAKQVEETRKKMQDLVNERNKIEKALKEKIDKEAKQNTEPETTKAEATKKKDGEADRPENKSQMGKSKVPAKQGVTTEPIPKLGGDLPDEKKPTDGNTLPPLPGATPKVPEDGKKTDQPNTLGVPEEPKLVANKSQSKPAVDPEAQQKKELEEKKNTEEEAKVRLEQQKLAEEELEKKKQQEMQGLKDLEANLVDSLEQGMSRHTVAKLSLSQAERLTSVLPRIKFSRYSSDGRFVLAITDIGGLFLFDSGTGIKRQEDRKVADLEKKEFFEYFRGGNKVFKYFHLLIRMCPLSLSGWVDTTSKLDAIFSPDDTEIFIYDAYTQVVLVYLVKEVIEHGFLVHPYYETIRQIPSLGTAHLAKSPQFKYKDIQNRKEGEPRFVIPLRGFYEYKPRNRVDDRTHEVKFMHFEKVVAGDQYFSPVDQDTLVIGTDEFVSRILISRFNQPKLLTNKSDKFDIQPEISVVQNKTYTEIFEANKNKMLSYAFTSANYFYTQTKHKKESSIVTLYKFNWEEFDDNDTPRLRMKRLNNQAKAGNKQVPFVMVVNKFQIASTISLFPQTLGPTGTYIYGYNQKSNEIRFVDLTTGASVKLLTLPPNRSGVSHMVVRHSGDYLLVVDNDGWFDIYNYNNELVEKGTQYSLLYSFFGVIETVLPSRFSAQNQEASRTHDYKLGELLAQGTGVFFFNNTNLYHYELDLPASNTMPAISKLPIFKNFVFLNRKVNQTYEILQTNHDDGEIMQRIVDFGNWNKNSQPFFKPVLQRTIQEYEENEHPLNFNDQPNQRYYVSGKENFLKLMKEEDPNRLKQLPEINAQLIQLNCIKLAGSYEYEVNLVKNKNKVNFKLAVSAVTDKEGWYTVRRLGDKHQSTLQIEDNCVWKLRIDPDPSIEVYQDKDENQEEEYSIYARDDYDGDETSHLFWNRYQGMYNFIPINDDGTYFLAPVRPYLKVLSVERGIEKEKDSDDRKPALYKNLPLLAKYGSVFWLSDTLVGAILLEDTEIQSELFVEWFPKGTKLTRGLLIFDLASKEEVKYHNVDFKIRDDKDEDLLEHDLKNVQVYPSGYKDLRFFITCDELLTFDTQKKVFLYNTANVREKQVVGIQKGPFQFMPNYVYKSCSFQTTRNNSTLALAAVQNPTFVRLYSLPKLELLEEIQLAQGASNQPVRMCFSHDSKYFLLMTSATVISVYSLNLEKFVEPIILPEKLFRNLAVVDINLVQESSYVELCLAHKNHFLIYRIPFYPKPRDLLLGALQKQFRLYYQVSNALGSAIEQKKIASEIAALISLQYPHQICLDNTLLKILCCHTAKEPLEAYLRSLKDKETVFKAAQLDVLAVIHEQVMEDNKDDVFQLNEKKKGNSIISQNAAKGSVSNHVLNSFIDAIGLVHEEQKRLPELSAKMIISWLSSKSLSSRYRTKLIELITFEPLNIIAKGALKSDTGMVSLIEARPPFEKTAKFVDTWSKELMDPESANVDEFNTYVTGIDFDLRNGSEFSLSYFNYLKEVSDEDLQLKYMGVIYYKWSQILYPATIYSFLYWILNGLITAFMGFSHTTHGLGWAIIVLNVIFISYEVKGISYDWKESWKDPWNYYDTISHSFTIIAVMILFKNPELTYDLSWLRIVSFVLISFRGVMMLRIFAGTRYLLVMLLEVFHDMVAFLSIFFWMTFGYWFMCLTRPSLTVGGKDLELKAAIGQSLDIAFSNFNANGLDTITLVTTIIGQILIALILLNYLISIVSKTSERISEQRELYDIKMLLDIIREFDLVFNGFRSSKEARNARYLILRPRPTVDEEVREVLTLFEEEKNKVEQTFRTEVTKIEETVMENIENFNSKISETQQSIVELLKLINAQQANTSQKEMQDFINRIKDLPRVVDLEKLEDDKRQQTQAKDKDKELDENEDDLYYHESSDDYASSDQEGSLSDDSEDVGSDEDEDEDDEESDD